MQRIRSFFTHPLISASSVVFLGSLVISLFNFLFNLFMSRNLSPEHYGTLAALVSLTMLFGLVGGAISPTIINFSATFFVNENLSMIRWLFFVVSKYASLLGIIFFLTFFLFKDVIGAFFNIHDANLVVLAGLIIFLSFVGIVNIPLLQGKLAFTFLTILNMIVTLLKLSLGSIFVLAGFSIYGAVWAIIVSQLAQYFISLIPLRSIFNTKAIVPEIKTKKLIAYGLPSAIAFFSLNSLINIDILLVKHFFEPHDAGIYAGLSLVGKVVFYFSAPISTVMFPLVVQRYEKKENYNSIFKLSLALVFLASSVIVIFYFLFPEFVISFFLKNKNYLEAASLLGIFGILVTLYALLSVVVNFYLSIKRTKVFIPLVIAGSIQAILISIYHESFSQIIAISIVTMLILLGLLLFPLLSSQTVSRKTQLSTK